MKTLSRIIVLIAMLVVAASAQKVSKPTAPSVEPNDAQKQTLADGVKLYEKGSYDEAIKLYKTVLEQSPDCAAAQYQLAVATLKRGDTLGALDLALKGTKYKAPELPLFYVLVGSIWDNQGKGENSVKLYQDALKTFKGDPMFENSIATMQFNLALSYVRIQKYAESREALKQTVKTDFAYASAHAALMQLFNSEQYAIPALLAAMRLASLEPDTARGVAAANLVVFKFMPARGENNSIQINLNFNAQKDEGEFALYELLIPTLASVKDEKKKADQTQEDIFVEAIESVIDMLADDKKLAKTFVGKGYIPFLREMKAKNFTATFAYSLLALSGSPAGKQLLKEKGREAEFLAWSKSMNKVITD